MYIYFSKNGKVNTILPHGEVPRQGGILNLYLLFDIDDTVTNTTLRYKLPTKNFFEADVIADTIVSEIEFNALTGENIGGLINGNTYKQQYYKLTNITDYAGNVEIAITKNTTSMLAKTIVFIEPTLGLEKNKGIGMTISEYDTLIKAINGFKDGNGEINVNVAKISEAIIKGVKGNLVPTITNLYDLGTTEKQWDELHLNNKIYFGEKEVLSVDEDRNNAKFGLDNNYIQFKSNKLKMNSVSSFEFNSNSNSISILSHENRVSNSTIEFDTNALRIFDSQEIDLSVTNTDGSQDKIKIGGLESFETNLEKKDNAFSYVRKSRLSTEPVDFGISKDGIVYYKGYPIANLKDINNLIERIDNLDYYNTKNDGEYIDGIVQTGGQISATKKAFDTQLSDNSVIAPQSKVVKAYVDTEKNQRQAADLVLIDAINTEMKRAENVEEKLANTDKEINTKLTDEIKTRTNEYQSLQSIVNKEITRSQNIDDDLTTRVIDIESKIPSAASEKNKLADKDFVNSSIATAAAEFRGTVTSTSALKALTGDDNDYAFLRITKNNTIQFDRYKYTSDFSSETGHWKYEYTLNNSSFTAEQWAALNSGISEELLEAITGRITTIENELSSSIYYELIGDDSSMVGYGKVGEMIVQ